MALKETVPPRKVGLTVTESAANTFTATEINMPITLGEDAFDLDKVEGYLRSTGVPSAINTNANTVVQLIKAQTTPTAMLNKDDKNLLFEYRIENTHGANSEIVRSFAQRFFHDHVGYQELVVNDSIFLCIESNNMAAVETFDGMLIGSVVSIKKDMLTTLLINELDS